RGRERLRGLLKGGRTANHAEGEGMLEFSRDGFPAVGAHERATHASNSHSNDSCSGCSRDRGLVHVDGVRAPWTKRRGWGNELGGAVLRKQRSHAQRGRETEQRA